MEEFNKENFEEQVYPMPEESTESEKEFIENQLEENIQEDKEIFTNPIVFSEVKPINDYKPMSKGLKVFSILLSFFIAISGACVVGFYIGKDSSNNIGSNPQLNLAAKPKDTDEYTPAQVYEMANASVVGIYVYNSQGKASQASGVIYSNDGYIVTNDHIYSEVSAPQFKVYTADGKEYDAKYIAGDTVSDLAVLKIDNVKLKAATFGNSKELVFGESVVAIGRPNDASNESSITKGIISALNRRVKTTSNYSASLIQTDSAINPGSSGGALLNMYGQVVGITSSKLAGVQYDAVGYAIPTTTVKRIVKELISDGKVTSRAKLGISYTVMNSVTAKLNNIDYVGLIIAEISSDSDLYGKVKIEDVITHINGEKITSDKIVLDIIEESKAGDKITLTIRSQKGTSRDYEVVLMPNVSESSYTLEESKENNNDSSEHSGGTFDFPFGE